MIARRKVLQLGGVGCAAALLPHAALGAGLRTVPQRASARVIVDNDFAGDPDGLVALAHQLFSPKTRTVLITSSALDPKFAQGDLRTSSAAKGHAAALDLIRRAAIKSAPPVVAGAELPAPTDPAANPAARAIVTEALREDKLPLFFTCGGPLTNLAAALALEPRIAQRMTVVWIGGGNYPDGGWEYNLAVDVDAARAVIERSAVPLWQVPLGAYRQMAYSVAAMRTQLRPISPFTAWLYDQFTTPPDFVDVGGAWPLGDSPLTLLTAISSESSQFTDRPARRLRPDLTYGEELPARMVRVFERLDARLAFDDFLALLTLHAQGAL